MAPRRPNDPLPPVNGLKKARYNSSQSSRMLSEWDKIEEDWCNQKCDELSQALIQSQAPRPSTSAASPFDLMNEGNEIDYENQHHVDDDQDDETASEITESDTESTDSQLSIASSPGTGAVVSAAIGDANQKRRIREERQWQEVIEPMFKVFMLCKRITLDWSRADWDLDRKPQCRCSVAKKRIRHLAMLDILTHTVQPVEFCSCQPDQVRLILMGYVGGSPVHPEIAFSLRFLRLHDAIWKYCCARTHPLAQAFDEYHRPAREFKEDVMYKPSRWGRTLSCAVDAYRRLIQLEKDLQSRAMGLSKKEKLGANCARCFGGNEYSKEEKEPDYVVCIDGNFQQRRHKSASVEVSEIEIRYPNLFLHPNEVNKWNSVHSVSSNDPPDPCTQMHTAANDSRSASTWRACDDTGLLALVCRHDHVLAFVNIVQSGEKSYFAHALIDWLLNELDETESKVAILYDIGCNLEKGLVRHNLFAQERLKGRFKFGTSVFHAYVHSWSCQLDYNPRINVGWGLSDGEGCERCWCKLCKLVCPLRYSTKQHRLDALDLKAAHENGILRTNSVHSCLHKLGTAEKTLADKRCILAELGIKRGYTHAYFAAQWTRQRRVQAEVIGDTNTQLLESQIEELVEYEEELREAKEKRDNLRRRRRRTAAENRTLASLPGHIIFLEEEVERVSLELGSDMFRNIPDASDPTRRLLIQVKVAKSNLYEAKVGIIELSKKWATGTSMQDRMKSMMNNKQKLFCTKWKTFHDLVTEYNNDHPNNTPLVNYTLDEAKALALDDAFWNFGHLTHPNEPWATDTDTQQGIQAYLLYCRSEEELRRISREVRQMLRWALTTDAKIQQVLTLSRSRWDPQAAVLPIDLVSGSTSARMTKTAWEDCTNVLRSSYHGAFLDHARLIFTWDCHLLSLLNRTRTYCGATVAEDQALESSWKDMVHRVIG